MRGRNLVWILFGSVLSAWGQPSNLRVTGSTPTQIVIEYDVPGPAACSVEVSESSGYSPLVHDVNASLFAGADLDLSRPDTIVDGAHRTVIAGKVGRYYQDAQGVWRSRALHAETTHYVRVNCGGAAATSGTTGIPPRGQTAFTEALPAVGAFRYQKPSLSPMFQTSYNDPETGVALQSYYASVMKAAFAGSTGATGVPFGLAENANSGWVASDGGTLVNAISADDDIYAQYGGTAGDWLFLGLGDNNYNKFPSNSTFTSNELSYQNVKLRLDCTGAGCGAGIAVEVCLVTDRDPTHCIQTKTITATTTEQEITLCQTAPCLAAAVPGDIWSPDIISRDDWALGVGRLYNTSADYTILLFTNQADCDRLRSGDLITWWNDQFSVSYQPRVTGTSCGANPPSVTVNSAFPADNNGASGVPFRYPTGIANNERFGFLVRKRDNTANATLRLDRGLWRAASYIGGSLASGSGGFNKRCQGVKTTNGYNLCAAGDLLYAVKERTDGSLDMKFLGTAIALLGRFPALTDDNGAAVYFGNGSSDLSWSDTEAGVFFIEYQMNVNSPASGATGLGIAKVTLTHPEIACGDPGTTCPMAQPDTFEFDGMWPIPEMTAVPLTTCLNSCASDTDDYSIAGQVKRLVPGYDFARFRTPSLTAVQGNHIVLSSREGNQDSFAHFFAFDVGNGGTCQVNYVGNHPGPFANQQVFAWNPNFATRGGRWGVSHTHQPVLYSDAFTIIESSSKCQYQVTMTNGLPTCSKSGAGNCGPCPGISLDGVDYTGKNWCANINLTSSWDPAWGSQPAAFADGDPVNVTQGPDCNNNYHYLQKLEVGDQIIQGSIGSSNEEVLKLIQRNSKNSWVVERGCHFDQSYAFPKTQGAGLMWNTNTQAHNSYQCAMGQMDFPYSQIWDFKRDPLAADTSISDYQNHAFTAGNYRAFPDYFVQSVDFTDWNAVKTLSPRSSLSLPLSFAGVPSICNGNECEKHPSYVNSASANAVNRSWFLDAHPLLFFYDSSVPVHTNVTGDLWKVGGPGGRTFDPKLFPQGGFLGAYPFVNVSGPGSSIGGTIADRGKFCIAQAANECRTGSSTGDMYFNGPLDQALARCRGVEFWSGQIDACFGNLPSMGASVAQWQLPAVNTVRLLRDQFRPLLRHWAYRESGTDNAKALPDGNHALLRFSPLYTKLPTWPGVDSVARDTFVGWQAPVQTPPSGTSRVLVKFGYDENFRCSGNRAEACYAGGAILNTSNPFLWATELGASSGSTCSGGCSIAVPAVSGRVVRYQVLFRDVSGNTLFASSVRTLAVP